MAAQNMWIPKDLKEGAFTNYAKRHKESMSKAITKGLTSANSTTRHRAQFAKNMRALAKAHKEDGIK